MNNFVKGNITAIQFNELRDFMQRMIEESMRMLDPHDTEHLMWYKDCTMQDYFQVWTELWDDEDGKVGEGVDTIAHKFVLNDETRSDFERAFEQARDDAFESVIEM